MNDLILSIDQGTSGSKAIIFNGDGENISEGRATLCSSYPSQGFVEQDPEEIYQSVMSAVRNALQRLENNGQQTADIRCCGISNQRETFLLWDRNGTALTKAIVWQCKRSVSLCDEILSAGEGPYLRNKTGLFVDPYFSGTKLLWLYRNIESIRNKIDSGEAYFGTIDTWILYKLTGGKSYKTDFTNASRTLLFNPESLGWEKEILDQFGLSKLNLPEPLPSATQFGKSNFEGLLIKSIPITGMIGDSHAAAFGEQCFIKGTAKATMGTGCSILLNSREFIYPEKTSMVSTICWSTDTEVAYALEGIIVSCGSTLNWLRDNLHLFSDPSEANEISRSLKDNGRVFLIPAFSGLGAPWWKMQQTGQIMGLTFDTDHRHIIRAGLESIAYQITDVLKAMELECGSPLVSVKIDGGVSSSSFITGMLAGLNTPEIIRCTMKEASSLGAALLSGIGRGIFDSLDELKGLPLNFETVKAEQSESLNQNYKQWLSIIDTL